MTENVETGKATEYIAWLRFRYRPDNGRAYLQVCDSDDDGAFKVYRHPDEREPVVPANQHKSLRPGDIRVGECPCGWAVMRHEKYCAKCGRPLDWSAA